MQTIPVGPKGNWLSGNLPDFGKDPLGFLTRLGEARQPITRLRFFNRDVYFLHDAGLIEAALVSKAKQFRKTQGYRTPLMRRLFGEGLLTSEGDFWLRQRKMSQPAFHRERINNYSRLIVQFTDAMLGRWESVEKFEVHREMMRLTTQVVTKSLFDAPVPQEIEQMNEASSVVMNRYTKQFTSATSMLTLLLPALPFSKFETVMRNLDRYIYALIEERRKSDKDHGDLLSMLLQARADSGESMNNKQLRDELTTLMVAGLDTTALALTWALYLLAQNPETQESVAASIPENHSFVMEQMGALALVEGVIKESMRLYPPAWIVGREAISNVVLGDYEIPQGGSVIMSQWVEHRRADYFSEPLAFRPSRWTSTETQTVPKFGYFPFGGGPRICIGSSFAMLEATMVLAKILQKFRVSCSPGLEAVPFPSITLQPKQEIELSLVPRKTAI